MATPIKDGTDRVTVQSVLPRVLAEQLKRLAEQERRTVSNTIRIAVEDRLRDRQP